MTPYSSTTATPNPDVLPALVLGVALDKPGQRPAYNGLKVLNRLRERGYKPGYLADDRAYNNSDPDEWQLPVRAMGYKPVYDYREDQLGKQAGTHGAILVEGRWYCPSMPEPLINATIDLHADRIERETWIKLIAARRGYRIMPKENADADGYQRMMCPAEASKAQCPIKPYTMGRGIHLPLIDPEPSPTGPLKICHQRTITIGPEAGAKQWQALDYGSPEWQKVYFRLRNSVEGYNGYAKNPLAEGIESAGSRRIRGIAAQTDPARLPAGPREPPQDQEVAGHALARRRASPPTHPLPPPQERTEELNPDRPPGTSGIDQPDPGATARRRQAPPVR